MAISTKLIRMQISFFKSLVNDYNIENSRSGQSKLGSIMVRPNRSKVCYDPKIFKGFIGEWIAPKIQRMDGVILYLHGGGYVTGDIDYAKGFGTTLAAKYGIQVFCAAYRLAPEHPFPAALEDAVTAYRYLLDYGYHGDQIVLCGESAGGGLCFSLTLKLKELLLPMPAGIIGISPWTDMTFSGGSYETNKDVDPTMSKDRLIFYAEQYCKGDFSNPYCSPLFGDFTGFPPTVIFVGGDEIMLDDSRLLYQKMKEHRIPCKLTIQEGMWHAYPLYGIEESRKDFEKIRRFLFLLLEKHQSLI